MKLRLKSFGITRDIMGGREVTIDFAGHTVADLKNHLQKVHPQLTELNSLFIAVNQSYAEDNILLKETDEIAIIPPVSGG